MTTSNEATRVAVLRVLQPTENGAASASLVKIGTMLQRQAGVFITQSLLAELLEEMVSAGDLIRTSENNLPAYKLNMSSATIIQGDNVVNVTKDQLQAAIIKTLTPDGIGGLTVTMAAILHKLNSVHSISVTRGYLFETVDEMVDAGLVVKTKNGSDHIAYALPTKTGTEEAKSPFYRATNGVLVISATARSEDDHKAMVGHYREAYKLIDMASTVFEMAQSFTDYYVRESVTDDMGTGGGYWDELTSAVFVDLAGKPLEAGASVSMNRVMDNIITHRLYVVVVKPGTNIIMHDRYSIAGSSGAECMIVKTAQRGSGGFVSAFNLLAGTNVWCNCFVDRVRMADIFGFEIKKEDGSVYPPSSRPTPNFSTKL